jgi:hypothetical protein
MVLAALIDVMTPQELVNNMGSLKQRCALGSPDFSSLVDAKLKKTGADRPPCWLLYEGKLRLPDRFQVSQVFLSSD